MGKTYKDNDYRKIRSAGKSVKCLFGSKPLRRTEGKSTFWNDEGKRILYSYTDKDLYDIAHRRHSAAHRNSARKTKHRVRRSEKRSTNRENLKDALDGE